MPDGVAAEDAVFAHLYALSMHCYTKAFFAPGETVAVVGLGVLGLGAVALGPLFGARVVGLGNSSVRLDMARQMGGARSPVVGRPRTSGPSWTNSLTGRGSTW